MKSDYKRLGDYIQLVDVRNRDLAVTRLLGININKQFMPSVANVSETDLTKYKIIHEGQFAYSAMQVGRDETVRVALFNYDEPAIISPAYLVFKVKDEEEVFPEYLMIWFQRPESDRYGWFISDSSVRASLEWERFCDIQIPIPDIEEQRKYVALYKALQKNQQTYEKSLDDLQLICDTFLEDLKNKESHKRIGDYIYQSDERNGHLKNDNLRAISVEKKFMASKSDKDKLNLASYKLIHPRQFGYVTVTSRNGNKISIAILEDNDCIVSSTYCVFGVTDTTVLLPEYLFLWFKRAEFDRYARFHSWGSARETFDWADMCNVKMPIPKIEVQESIVAIHHTLETRKRLNSELKNQIQNLCPILMRSVVEGLSANESEDLESREAMG
jgi:type I restriction enzyme S subunit